MNTVTRIALPVLAGAALLSFASAGVSAAAVIDQQAAAPRPVVAMAHLTQGFEIRNLSSHDIRLSSIESPGNGDGTPAIGTVLRPGDAIGYQKVFWFGNTPHTKLWFTELSANGQVLFPVELWVDPFLNIPSVMTPGADGAGDLAFSGTGYGSKVLNFVDRPGAAPIQVSPQDKQKQADLLGRLCAGGQAACTFTPTSSEAGPDLTARWLSDKNIGTTTATVSYKDSLTIGSTTSVELTASAKVSLFGSVDLTMAGKYGQGWSQSKTAEITRSFPVPPGRRGIVEAFQPSIRQHGTFIVTMGNTRWELNDVHFDIPDKSVTPEVQYGDVAA
jgi:hypothetical protein